MLYWADGTNFLLQNKEYLAKIVGASVAGLITAYIG